MKGFILLAVGAMLIASSHGAYQGWESLPSYTFEEYVEDFNKVYSTEGEFKERKAIFEARLKEIIAHNNAGRGLWQTRSSFTLTGFCQDSRGRMAQTCLLTGLKTSVRRCWASTVASFTAGMKLLGITRFLKH